jgi:hypothetical protein
MRKGRGPWPFLRIPRTPTDPEERYDPEPRRDWLRAAITLSLIFVLFVISGVALYSAHGDFNKTKELLDKLLPALAGLIGSALGFHFGSKSSNA